MRLSCPLPMLPLFVTLFGLSFLPTALSFKWAYPVAPRQCSTFNITVTGTDVVFPLKALIVPVGPSPLPHEVRKVMEVPFPPNAMSVSFQLPYPTSSSFVGLVSDASGYRGTASTWTVLSSGDSSCFDATRDFIPPFNFSLSPSAIAECRDVRIYWDPAKVQGLVSFLSVVPDSRFGSIPITKIDTQPGLGTGFTWTPAVAAATNLIIVGGDYRGMGTGGFISSIVNPGNPGRDPSGFCLAPGATPVSTVFFTQTADSTSTSASSSASALVETPTPGAKSAASGFHVGTTDGGVVGGILLFCSLVFVF